MNFFVPTLTCLTSLFQEVLYNSSEAEKRREEEATQVQQKASWDLCNGRRPLTATPGYLGRNSAWSVMRGSSVQQLVEGSLTVPSTVVSCEGIPPVSEE